MLGAEPAWASFSLSLFFPPTLCFRPENREEIQTKITSVPLPEKCAPAPRRYPLCSEGKVTLRQLGGDEGEFAGAPPRCMDTWDSTFVSPTDLY